MERTILHCDMNNFFASVSLLYNQTLIGEPVAVCGDKENRHGIILAKNELAKQYGVKTAEPIFEAQRKCPGLYLLPPLYEEYERFSKAAKAIYLRYTDLVESFGMDECWLDVTGSRLLFGDGETIARRIRQDMINELGVSVSVGISFNKVFAKLGSDMKKPNGQTLITRENFKQVVWPLPVEDLLFVGKRTAEQLRRIGVLTIGDLAICPTDTLQRLFGKNGMALHRYAWGNDTGTVHNHQVTQLPKSIGRSETTAEDLTDEEAVWQALLSFGEEIAHHLYRLGLSAGGIQLCVRFPDLKTKEYSMRLNEPTAVGLSLAKAGMELYHRHSPGVCRSVGLRATLLCSNTDAVQTGLFDNEAEQKKECLGQEIIRLKERYGTHIIDRGTVWQRQARRSPSGSLSFGRGPFKRS